jgi:nitrogen regulatory protein PII
MDCCWLPANFGITASDGTGRQLPERVKFELIVADQQVDEAVNIILRYALPESHQPNGHVRLLDISEALQIAQPGVSH